MPKSAVQAMNSFLSIALEFRDLVNKPRVQQRLVKEPRGWNQLCSAMDVAEDTSMAIRSYSSQEDTTDKGKLYLETYGLLQALKVRQDAVLDLCASVGSRRGKGDFPGLESVRSARVSVAGHPTRRQREDGLGPHSLVQMSLHRNSIEVMSFSAHGPKFKHISLSNLISGQEAELAKILGGVIADLKEEDAQIKARFVGNKLEDVFPSTLSYSFEKIYEQIRGGCSGLGLWGLDEVSRILNEYRQGLEERRIQIEAYDAIKYHYELIAYPLHELKSYLEGKASEVSGPQAGEIFAYFIQGQLDELRTFAREIDEEFGS